jgi:hypothetical protein
MSESAELVSWTGNAKKAPALSQIDSTEWVGKAEAARLLGVHPRQLERRAHQGRITKRVLPRKPSEKAARVVYSRADIEDLKRNPPEAQMDQSELALLREHEEKERERERAATERERNITTSVDRLIATIEQQNKAAVPVANPVSQSIAPDPFAGLAAHLAALSAAFPPPGKPWLSLREAAGYSGLPARWLRAAARAGKLRAQNVGDKRERWMFPRDGLN